MKKWAAIFCMAVLLTVSGCGTQPEADSSDNGSSVSAPQESESSTNTENSEESSQEVSTEESAADSTEVQVTDSLETIMEALYQGLDDQLPVVGNTEITTENASYYLGIEDPDMEEGLASDAMMRAVAHSVCLVRAAEGADVEALEQQIRENANPNKWICVGVNPENVIVDHIDDLIVLIMNDDCGQAIHENFLALAE